jgi:hypothetical protein
VIRADAFFCDVHELVRLRPVDFRQALQVVRDLGGQPAGIRR